MSSNVKRKGKDAQKTKKKVKLDNVNDEEEEFEVEAILNHRVLPNKQIEYLIRWRGYSPAYDTYEPAKNLNCPRLLKAYQQQMKSSDQSTPPPPSPCSSSTVTTDRMSSKGRTTMIRKPLLAPSSADTLHIALQRWEDAINEQCRLAAIAEITVENVVDNDVGPVNFVFGTKYRPSGDAANIDLHTPIVSCECEAGSCARSKQCCPQSNESVHAYGSNGRLIRNYLGPIFECNSGCRCSITCSNRVVQRGRRHPLCIYKTERCGWGVKAGVDIPALSFVTEYIGSIITTKEARKRSSKYMFDLDYDHVPIYSIDAEFYGNEAHFINHSCEPNLMAMAVYVDCIDAKLPRLSFFSTRDIKSGMYIDTHHKLLAFQGEQLCFDYRPSFNIQHQVYTVDDVSQVDDDADDDDVNEEGCERKTISAIEQHEICYCGAGKCRGRLIF